MVLTSKPKIVDVPDIHFQGFRCRSPNSPLAKISQIRQIKFSVGENARRNVFKIRRIKFSVGENARRNVFCLSSTIPDSKLFKPSTVRQYIIVLLTRKFDTQSAATPVRTGHRNKGNLLVHCVLAVTSPSMYRTLAGVKSKGVIEHYVNTTGLAKAFNKKLFLHKNT